MCFLFYQVFWETMLGSNANENVIFFSKYFFMFRTFKKKKKKVYYNRTEGKKLQTNTEKGTKKSTPSTNWQGAHNSQK